MALLLRTNRAVQFRKEEDVATFLQERNFPKTGFINAMNESQVKLSEAKFKCSRFQSGSTKRPEPASDTPLDKRDMFDELSAKETFLAKRRCP